WSLVERHRVTHLGISPTAIRGLMRAGEDPVRAKDRSSLFVLGSTGEPWNPDPWWWYFRNVGDSRCPIINYSGGTEISGGIVGCTTWTPIQPSSFAGPCPGMDADVVDDRGRSVRGAGGGRVRGRRASRRVGGGSDRRAARDQGRGHRRLRGAAPAARADTRARAVRAGQGRRNPRQTATPRGRPLRDAAAEDAQRED